MKKLSIALVAAIWATTALAGSYHRGTSLICSDCHTMHASRSHKFGGTGSVGTDAFISRTNANPTNLNPWVPNDGGINGNRYLLMAGTPNDTCLACHDGTAGVPDVVGVSVNGGFRAAGQTNLLGSGNEQHGHTIDIDLATNPPPGWTAWRAGQASNVWTNSPANGFDAEFACDDCHAVHGNAAYRNLANGRGRVAGNFGWTGNWSAGYTWGLAPTYAWNATAPAAGMLVPARFDVDVVVVPSGKAVGNINQGDQYDARLVSYAVANNDVSTSQYVAAFNATNGTVKYYTAGAFAADQNNVTTGKNKMNGFCGACHGNFHGNSAVNTGLTPEKFKKHPTTGVSMNTSSLIAPAAQLAVKPIFSGATTFEPGCLSCHRAHGTTSMFGLVLPGDKALGGATWANLDTDYENGDSAGPNATVRFLCQTCHGQGRTGAQDPVVSP